MYAGFDDPSLLRVHRTVDLCDGRVNSICARHLRGRGFEEKVIK